ncbi:MAG: aldose epimerase family protein [Bacillota bacterium]|nr:aldose epimerase family protein [Bacillota bacterium]
MNDVQQPDKSAWIPGTLGTDPQLGELLTFTRRHPDGSQVTLSTLGARILSIQVPDRSGRVEEVTQTFDHLEDWLGAGCYHGAVCGRYANRIGGAAFALNGRHYKLPANERGNTLHGGVTGFHRKNWTAQVQGEDLIFRYSSPDGEEGFPGRLDCEVRYRFDADHTLTLDYRMQSDRDTVASLTNHVFFNIGGPEVTTVSAQELQIAADFITEVDAQLLPTGAILPVAGTPFDFTAPKLIGRDIEAEDRQLEYGGGYDHNFVLRQTERGALTEAACVYDPASGRELICRTTLPGLQIYTTNSPIPVAGAGGRRYGRFSGICLETQLFPDSPNRTWFPSPLLRAGEVQTSTTVYAFGVRSQGDNT